MPEAKNNVFTSVCLDCRFPLLESGGRTRVPARWSACYDVALACIVEYSQLCTFKGIQYAK